MFRAYAVPPRKSGRLSVGDQSDNQEFGSLDAGGMKFNKVYLANQIPEFEKYSLYSKIIDTI